MLGKKLGPAGESPERVRARHRVTSVTFRFGFSVGARIGEGALIHVRAIALDDVRLDEAKYHDTTPSLGQPEVG